MDTEPHTEFDGGRHGFDRMPPPDHRFRTRHHSRALVLRAGGATVEDVATELGMTPSVVVRLLRQGMAALRVRSQAELIAALGGRAAPEALPGNLTRAERDVVRLVLEGRSNAEIALTRGTSPRTVANQLQAIYAKLHVGSRRELVAVLLGPPPVRP